MMGTYLSFYFYFFLKAKTQISALVEFTESFLQYRISYWLILRLVVITTTSVIK